MMERRSFLQHIGIITFASFSTLMLSNFIISCEQDEVSSNVSIEKIKLDDYKALIEIGGITAIFFKNNPKPILVKRISEEEFIVVDRTCTHKGCTVGMPQNNLNYMECLCHGAKFSVDDFTVIQNPNDGSQIKPLKRYAYSFNKETNELIIDFSKVL